MSSDTDPLLLLQQAIKSNTDVLLKNDSGSCSSLADATSIVINGQTFPKSSRTRYRKAGSSSESYTLDAVYMAWQLRDAAGAEYMKQARENGLAVGFVSVTERKHLVEWLEGKAPDNDRIAPLTSAESTTPPGTPPRSTAQTVAATPRARAAGESTTATATKRKYVPDTHDIEVVKKIRQNEVELRDRTTVLRGTKPNNFNAVRLAYSEKLKKLKTAPAQAAPTPAADPKLQARKARHHQPIILISPSPIGLLSMYNVKRFLEDSVFEAPQDAKKRSTAEGNLKHEDMIPIYRKRTTIDTSGKETVIKNTYFVVDSVDALSKFGTDAWDRVVCVVTTGQEWQFRRYKWTDPLQLFHNVKGVYVSWANEPPNKAIKNWNVSEIKVDPYRRHVDKSVVAHFWAMLDSWIQTHKPSLVKS